MLRDAVAATPEDSPDLAGRLSNLSGALQLAYARFRVAGALDESVAQGRRALALTRPGDPHAPSHASNLAAALRTRFETSGDLSDLEESIALGRLAVSGSEATSPRLPGRLSNLCNALRTHWERTGDGESLREAIDCAQRAAELAGPGHPQRAAVLSNLGSALHARYGVTGELDDLLGAVSVGEEGLILTSPDDDEAAGRLSNVGLMRRDLYRRTGERAHLDRAVTLARRAVESGPRERNVGAVLSGLSGSLLLRFQSTGTIADLVEGVRTAREALAAAPAGHPARAAAMMNLSNAIQVLVAEIRRRRGFERFLLAPELSQLQQAAAVGPVAAINVHDIRSDALIVTRGGVTKVELPALTPAAVNQQVLKLLAEVETVTDTGVRPSERLQAETAITEVLGWLWDNVAAAVLDRLDEDGLWEQYGAGRRLWWCPTGALAYLPLHAAGRPDVRASARGSPCSVVDRVVSSYTPTIRALLDARQPLVPPRTGPPEIAVVAMPETSTSRYTLPRRSRSPDTGTSLPRCGRSGTLGRCGWHAPCTRCSAALARRRTRRGLSTPRSSAPAPALPAARPPGPASCTMAPS